MITHDGATIVSVETGSFLKIEDILFIEARNTLEGLKRISPLKIYFKQEKEPIGIPYHSVIRAEIYTALSLFQLNYSEQYPFVVYRSGYVVNLLSISRMTQRGTGSYVKYKVLFNTGLEIDVPVEIYSALFDIFKESVKLDNDKFVKKSIPGFMETGK